MSDTLWLNEVLAILRGREGPLRILGYLGEADHLKRLIDAAPQPSTKDDSSPQVSHTDGAVTYTSHTHRCMSCGARWYCPHKPGNCNADENVLPSLVLPGPDGPTVFHHVCRKP